MSRSSFLILLMSLLFLNDAVAVSPRLQAARATTDADSAITLYHAILRSDGRGGEGPEALTGLLDYFCFTRQIDSLNWYQKIWHADYSCPGLNQTGDCWRVQLGVFADRENAFRLANSLRRSIGSVEVIPQAERYLVVSSCYPGRRQAKTAARSWHQGGLIDDFMLRKTE